MQKSETRPGASTKMSAGVLTDLANRGIGDETPKNSVYKYLGFTFVALACAGVVLPVLPTTPFILLAASCFAKSSDKWHAWLLQSPTFGKLIRNWDEYRCITRRSKIIAFTSMVAFGGYSTFFVLESIYAQAFTAGLVCYAMFFVGRVKTCESCPALGSKRLDDVPDANGPGMNLG